MGGVVADLWGLRAAVWVAAAITLVSASVVAFRMYETHPPPKKQQEPQEAGDG
jgi:predicted MFS family arabinose efflux permease